MSDEQQEQQQGQQQEQQQEQQQQRTESKADQKTDPGNSEKRKENINKLENPQSIPTAGGKKLGEDHMGESQMLKEGQSSNPADNEKAEGGSELGEQQSGEKKGGSGEEEKKGFVGNVKDKLGMGHHKE